MTNRGRTVALIGSGRWGRIHASNLAQILSPSDRILWVSRHNRNRAREIIKELPENGPSFDLTDDPASALRERPIAVLAVNGPADHFEAAKASLTSGAHVFIEKPLCLKLDEARTLVKLANRERRVAAVGLHLLSASYLFHFKSCMVGRAISQIRVRWCDPEQEIRYGEEKRANHSAPLAHDLFPHFWSIIYALTDTKEMDIDEVTRYPNGAVRFSSRAELVRCDALFHRGADARVRFIEVAFADGGVATIDFTQEPGVSTCDDAALPVDPTWGTAPRPLIREVSRFFECIANPSDDGGWPQLASNCIDSVAGAEILNSKLAALC
jgi:predicted dehydrogenase